MRQPLQLAYAWRYLFLAVDGRAGTLHGCWIASLAADEMLAAVGSLQQTGELAALVWDGAPSHRDASVQAVGLPLIGLPPYSPELNPAERVFQELRRAIDGQVYATLDEKAAAVETELATWDADPARVRSLAGWDWIDEAVVRLPADHAA
ncbi:MAG: transposase [Chloroflexi bacterium]|nr:transposase [Chloroflexota bacterium]